MNLHVTEYPHDICVYGSPSARAAVCRGIRQLGLLCTEAGSSPEELGKHPIKEDTKLVIALGSGDIFGKIRAELLENNSALEPMIVRDIEFFSELLTYAQVTEAPLCPEPQNAVAVGMNIDFVLGGAETWATQLFYSLKEKVALQGGSVKIWELRQDSPYLYVGREFYGIAQDDVVRFGRFDSFVDYVLAILEQLTRQPPALYFDNGSMQVMAAFFLAKRYLGLKTRIISVVHGNVSIFMDRVVRYQKAIDKVAAVSDAIAENLRSRLPHRKKDINVYLQLPSGHPASIGKKGGATLRIAYAARLERNNKRSLWLLDVMDALAAAGVNFDLSIAGDGECYGELEEHIRARKLEGRVHLLGRLPHEEMDDFYSDKDVFLSFSINEGGPLTLFESLSHGLVPVVTDAGCAKRFIREEENGFLIASPAAAAEVLQRLAQDLDACRALGEKALAGYISQREKMEDQVTQWLAECGLIR